MRIMVASLVAAVILAPPETRTVRTECATPRRSKARGAHEGRVRERGRFQRRIDVVAQGATVTLAFSGNTHTFTLASGTGAHCPDGPGRPALTS